MEKTSRQPPAQNTVIICFSWCLGVVTSAWLPKVRVIPLINANKENFAAFGTILGDDMSDSGTASEQYASVRVCNPSKNFASDEDTCILLLCYGE